MIDYLDNILIYINKVDHVESLWWVFNQLSKDLLYSNLKKYRFHQDEMQFFS